MSDLSLVLIPVPPSSRYPRSANPCSDSFKELIAAHIDVYKDCIGHAKLVAARRPAGLLSP